ncbi:Zn-ribbon domain-containing OB-fold protein [Paralcaligenes ginsengisoli]
MKPVPRATFETEPFWQACADGFLTYQCCSTCGHVQFYPRTVCVRCHNSALEWKKSNGTGSVHTFTIVHRAPSAPFKPDVPYAITLIDLDEGFRIMANMLECSLDAIYIGMRVDIGFECRGDGAIHLPQAYPRRA